MEKGNWELWGVYSRGAFEFEIGAGNPYVWEKREEKNSHTHRASRVSVEIIMGKGAGKPMRGSLYQTQMFRQQFSGCPQKGSEPAVWDFVFLTTKGHVKSVAGSFPLPAQWLPEALKGSMPCAAPVRHRLGCLQARLVSVPACQPHQGWTAQLAFPDPCPNRGMQELEGSSSPLNATCLLDLALWASVSPFFKWEKSFVRYIQDVIKELCKE